MTTQPDEQDPAQTGVPAQEQPDVENPPVPDVENDGTEDDSDKA